MSDAKDVVCCSACKKEVSRNKLGTHILSSTKMESGETHLAYFLRHNEPLLKKIYQQYVVEGKKLSSTYFPKFKVGRDEYHICFGCKKAYVNDNLHLGNKKCCESYLGWVRGQFDPEKSKDDRIKELEALLASHTSGKVGEASQPVAKPSTAHIERIEDLESQIAEKDSEIELKDEEIFKYRDLLKAVLKDKFPPKLSSPTYFEELEEAVKALTAPPPEAPKPPPLPRLNEERIAAYVAATAARNWDAQNAVVLSDAEMAVAHKRIEAAESAPRVTTAFKPPPLAPQVLTSTIRRPGKMTQREMNARGLLPA